MCAPLLCYWLANFSHPCPWMRVASLDVLILYDNLYCIIVLSSLYYCIYPFSLLWVPVLSILPSTCLLVFSLLQERTIYLCILTCIWLCMLPVTLHFEHWHWHFLLVNCLLPLLLRTAASVLILISPFKLRQVGHFASCSEHCCLINVWLIDIASVARPPISISGF